jgi:hypothetical protein
MIIKASPEVKKWIHFIVAALVMVGLCLGSAWNNLYRNSKNTVSVEMTDPKYLSVNGHTLMQELKLEGTMQRILLFCDAPSGAAYQGATVTFSLTQGEKRSDVTVRAADISSPYTPGLKYSRFNEGTAVLTITGSGFPEGTDLFFYSSADADAGLKPVYMDGSETPGPILLMYDVQRHDQYFVYDTLMIIIMCAVALGVAWLLVFRRERMNSGKGLFFCSALLLFVYISLCNPLASFLADPSSEMVYEFWYKAKTLSFTENMMSLMSGESIVWPERLIMWLAVKLSGGGKYVFIIAQIMQTALVSAVSSMLCLPTFNRYFPAEIRLVICWYIGGAMMFPNAYYFWAVSYWACFFIIPFAFVDMEKMRRWQYALALAVTVILCVSRIYHILLIPIALLALIALGKARGKRFSLYCIVVAMSSAFEVVYSMSAGGDSHIDLSRLNIVQFIENGVYYQIQVLSSMLFGDSNLRPTMSNFIFLIIFIAIIVLAVWLLVFNWKDIQKRTIGCILTSLGVLSFGSVMINVTVCGCSSSVAFAKDYASKVDWNTTVYQEADLHFSYSYLAVAFIILTIAYWLVCCIKKKDEISDNTGTVVIKKNSSIPVIAIMAVLVTTHSYPCNIVRMVPTDWKNTYWVTSNQSYYLPVNVVYGVADISMYHNSTSIICGMTDSGEEALWAKGVQSYSMNYDYDSIAPGKVSDLAERKMLSLTVRKSSVNFAEPLVMVMYDSAGNVLGSVTQTNSTDRYIADFMLESPVENVYSVSFQHQDGSPAYVREGVQIGVAL